MVENGYAETKARLGTDQLWLLLAHILHFQAIYELAKLRLRPELFNGRDEAGMRLLWQVVLQADAAGAAGQFFTNKPYAWNYLTAEAKQYAESHPEDLAPEFYDLLFGQSPLGLLPWIYNGVGGNEMGESWGRQLLADFLTERYVEDPLRRAVESSSGMVLQNLPTLLQEATDRRSEVASIHEDVAQLAWQDGYTPQPLILSSTGVDFLDPFLRGGHANGEVYGVTGSYGGGKCLGKGTPVITYDGKVVQVEEIKEGDRLMGPDSRPRLVMATTSGMGRLYKVTPVKGDPYIVNGAHILSLKLSPKKAGQAHQLVNISVEDYLRKGNYFHNQHKGWRAGVEYTQSIWGETTVDPYFLGVWLGDGHSANTRVTTMDPEVVECLRATATSYGLRLSLVAGRGRASTYGIVGEKGHGNPLLDQLRELGELGNKHIPAGYMINSRQVRLQLLAGLLDADGYINKSGCDYISVRKELADGVVFLARSLGLAAYRTDKWVTQFGGKMYYRVSISGDLTEIPFRVARRKPPARRQKKNVLTVGIRVEPVGEGEYFGFELDGDGLFLLGDFTVTHNSTLSVQLAVGVAKFEQLREAQNPDHKIRYSFVFFYEGSNSLWHQRLISHAAQIHFDTASLWGEWDVCHPSTMGQLKAYELDRWRDEIEANGGPHQTMGERERFETFVPQVRRNVFLCDMTGPKGKPKQGSGYVPEIAAAVGQQVRKGRPPGVVVIDYAGICARRHRNELGLPDTALRHLIGEFCIECERQIAVPFDCPVWVMHQMSGEANARTHSSRAHHTDAAEAKNFGENAFFCFNLGTKDPVYGSILMTVTKTRRSKAGRPPRLYIDGGLTTLRRAIHLVEDARGRVHTRTEFEQTHGFSPDDALFDAEETEAVA